MNHDGFSRIVDPYLLVIPIPYYVDADGSIWLDPLWCKDLIHHLEYIERLTVIAPKHQFQTGAGDLVKTDFVGFPTPRFVGLLAQDSTAQAILSLPNTIYKLCREILKTHTVHSGILGWPYPLGWIANPLALLLGKKLILVVESAPWRLNSESVSNVKNRIRAYLTERIGRYFANKADLLIATHGSYISSLCGANKSHGTSFVNPASWINHDDIMSDKDNEQCWLEKIERSPNFLFAGRLTRDKGIEVLLQATAELDGECVNGDIVIIGHGPLDSYCRSQAEGRGNFRLTVMDPIPYGKQFFEFIRHFHAVVVPSLSDEQPRILFDAFSQGVPVIASNTDGLRPYIQPDANGWLVESGSVDSLTSMMRYVGSSLQTASKCGMSALEVARCHTHTEMHRSRSRVIAPIVNDHEKG